MQVHVNPGNGIETKDTLERWATEEIQQRFHRFREDLQRVDVHFNEQNHAANGNSEKRCSLEARLAGRGPVAVAHDATTLEASFKGGMDKLERAMDSALGRSADHRERVNIRRDSDSLIGE